MEGGTHSRRSRLGRRLRCVFVAMVLAALLLPSAAAHAQPPVPPSTLSLGASCSPDTFPPNRWVVLECVTDLANHGENPISNVSITVGAQDGWPDDPLPYYYWVSYLVNGRKMPVSGYTNRFESDDVLQPGQRVVSHLTVLVKMSEGTWHGMATLKANGVPALEVPVPLTASSDLPLLPDNLSVTQTFSSLSQEGSRASTVTYETKVTNRGPSPVRGVKISQRFGNARLIRTDPSPSERNDDLSIVSWDVSSFNSDVMDPQETFTILATYGPPIDNWCGGMSEGTLVEGDVGGMTERHGIGPDEMPLVGSCPDLPKRYATGASDLWVVWHDGSLPESFGAPEMANAGDGPAARTFDFIWAAAFLATAGAGLVAAAYVARRRLRT